MVAALLEDLNETEGRTQRLHAHANVFDDAGENDESDQYSNDFQSGSGSISSHRQILRGISDDGYLATHSPRSESSPLEQEAADLVTRSLLASSPQLRQDHFDGQAGRRHSIPSSIGSKGSSLLHERKSGRHNVSGTVRVADRAVLASYSPIGIQVGNGRSNSNASPTQPRTGAGRVGTSPRTPGLEDTSGTRSTSYTGSTPVSDLTQTIKALDRSLEDMQRGRVAFEAFRSQVEAAIDRLTPLPQQQAASYASTSASAQRIGATQKVAALTSGAADKADSSSSSSTSTGSPPQSASPAAQQQQQHGDHRSPHHRSLSPLTRVHNDIEKMMRTLERIKSDTKREGLARQQHMQQQQSPLSHVAGHRSHGAADNKTSPPSSSPSSVSPDVTARRVALQFGGHNDSRTHDRTSRSIGTSARSHASPLKSAAGGSEPSQRPSSPHRHHPSPGRSAVPAPVSPQQQPAVPSPQASNRRQQTQQHQNATRSASPRSAAAPTDAFPPQPFPLAAPPANAAPTPSPRRALLNQPVPQPLQPAPAPPPLPAAAVGLDISQSRAIELLALAVLEQQQQQQQQQRHHRTQQQQCVEPSVHVPRPLASSRLTGGGNTGVNGSDNAHTTTVAAAVSQRRTSAPVNQAADSSGSFSFVGIGDESMVRQAYSAAATAAKRAAAAEASVVALTERLKQFELQAAASSSSAAVTGRSSSPRRISAPAPVSPVRAADRSGGIRGGGGDEEEAGTVTTATSSSTTAFTGGGGNHTQHVRSKHYDTADADDGWQRSQAGGGDAFAGPTYSGAADDRAGVASAATDGGGGDGSADASDVGPSWREENVPYSHQHSRVVNVGLLSASEERRRRRRDSRRQGAESGAGVDVADGGRHAQGRSSRGEGALAGHDYKQGDYAERERHRRTYTPDHAVGDRASPAHTGGGSVTAAGLSPRTRPTSVPQADIPAPQPLPPPTGEPSPPQQPPPQNQDASLQAELAIAQHARREAEARAAFSEVRSRALQLEGQVKEHRWVAAVQAAQMQGMVKAVVGAIGALGEGAAAVAGDDDGGSGDVESQPRRAAEQQHGPRQPYWPNDRPMPYGSWPQQPQRGGGGGASASPAAVGTHGESRARSRSVGRTGRLPQQRAPGASPTRNTKAGVAAAASPPRAVSSSAATLLLGQVQASLARQVVACDPANPAAQLLLRMADM